MYVQNTATRIHSYCLSLFIENESGYKSYLFEVTEKQSLKVSCISKQNFPTLLKDWALHTLAEIGLSVSGPAH